MFRKVQPILIKMMFNGRKKDLKKIEIPLEYIEPDSLEARTSEKSTRKAGPVLRASNAPFIYIPGKVRCWYGENFKSSIIIS
jgi:hypothetical protein